MQFKDIIGHHSLKAQLIHTVLDNRVSHAQLFLGPEGSGNLALAIAYAQFINCESRLADDSCGHCASCRKYNKLIHPDLHFSYPFFAKGKDDVARLYLEEWRLALANNRYLNLDFWRAQLDADNKQANINIAEAHDIIKKLSLKSFEAEYKVLIMWLPEFLDKEGNSLLKLLEEPPAKTLFLLVSENADRILNTIISRTQLVKVPKYQHEEVQRFLVEEKQVAAATAQEIALIADGNIQAALELMDNESGPQFELLLQWLRYVVTDNGLSLIGLCEEEFPKLGRENQKNFILYAIHMLRQIILMQQGLAKMVLLQDRELDFVRKFSAIFQLEQLREAIDILEKTHYKVERNANPKILFLDLSLHLVLVFKYQTFPQGTQYII